MFETHSIAQVISTFQPVSAYLLESAKRIGNLCLVFFLLHLLRTVNVMSCVLHNPALILNKSSRGNPGLEDLLQLLRTGRIR